MKVYGVSVSPYVRKVLIALAEKQLAFEHVRLRPGDTSPEFRAASPLGKVPGFSDGDFVLADSSAICAYLEKKHPRPALVPDGAEDYGRMIWFEELGDTILAPAAGRCFFNRVVQPRFNKKPGDEAAVKKAIDEDLPPLFDYLERQLKDGKLPIAPGFTHAEIALFTHFVNLRYAGVTPDAGRWPNLVGWVEAVNERPSVQQALEADARLFERVPA